MLHGIASPVSTTKPTTERNVVQHRFPGLHPKQVTRQYPFATNHWPTETRATSQPRTAVSRDLISRLITSIVLPPHFSTKTGARIAFLKSGDAVQDGRRTETETETENSRSGEGACQPQLTSLRKTSAETKELISAECLPQRPRFDVWGGNRRLRDQLVPSRIREETKGRSAGSFQVG